MTLVAELLASPYLLEGVAVTLAVIFLSGYYGDFAEGFPYSNVPSVGWDRWALTNRKAKQRFVTSSRALIKEGFDQGKSAFQLLFAFRPVIVLHPRYLEEVKSHPHLDFQEATRSAFFGGRIPGFEIFASDDSNIILSLINKKLTHNLGQLTIPLSRETAATLKDTFSESREWSSHNFSKEIPRMVARLSSLVFIGEEICHDQEWLDVSVNFTIDAFVGARELRLWPGVLRPFVHWFLPSLRRTRKHLRNATKIVEREIVKRGLVQGKIPEKVPSHRRPDALDWSHEVAAGRPFNATQLQIGLSLAAIHTTSNLLTNVIYDLAAYPEYFQPLREEIKAVAEEDGVLQKTSLTKLRLMDSVIKETQRMNPVSMTSIHRHAQEEIPLSDGTIIPKGAKIVVAGSPMSDESIYPDARTYNGYRFLSKRQEPGNAHRFQLVTTTTEHFAFGHGTHACPGRFFAANEVKILLLHMVMKYEWKFAGSSQERPKNFDHGTEIICNPTVEMLFRARDPDMDLARLGEVAS